MLKSLNKIVLYVSELQKSINFYQGLGFKVINVDKEVAILALDQFNIELVPTKFESKEEFVKEAEITPRGSGIYLLIEVDEVNEFFDSIKEKGFSPSSQPRSWDWGRREFVLRDPDGYKLVFYHLI